MPLKQFVLSPCGISLLTNQVHDDPELRQVIFRYANSKTQASISNQEVQDRLEQFIDTISARIGQADCQEAAKMSAEINGITKIYQDADSKNSDYNLLLCTDTRLGEETAQLEKKWLLSKNPNLIVEV